MVLHRLVFGDEVEQVVFAHNTAEAVDNALELTEGCSSFAECRRLFEARKRVIFNLANTLAGDAVLLADRLKGDTVRNSTEAKTRLEDST